MNLNRPLRPLIQCKESGCNSVWVQYNWNRLYIINIKYMGERVRCLDNFECLYTYIHITYILYIYPLHMHQDFFITKYSDIFFLGRKTPYPIPPCILRKKMHKQIKFGERKIDGILIPPLGEEDGPFTLPNPYK